MAAMARNSITNFQRELQRHGCQPAVENPEPTPGLSGHLYENIQAGAAIAEIHSLLRWRKATSFSPWVINAEIDCRSSARKRRQKWRPFTAGG
jgi:hypothetical protein